MIMRTLSFLLPLKPVTAMFHSLPSALALTLIAVPSLAAPARMEDGQYVARRLAAPHHVQVATEEIVPTEGRCTVSGRVVRSFRGRLDGSVSFSLPCDESAFWPEARLRAAQVLEVVLKPGVSGLEIADDGQGIRGLETASEKPALTEDPVLARRMAETMALYTLDGEIKRGQTEAALALAEAGEPDSLKLRLLAQVAGGFSARKPEASARAVRRLFEVFDGMAADDTRREAGLSALEPLALGGAKDASLALAGRLEPEVEAMTVPSDRDKALSIMYGARLRSGDVAGAFGLLGRLTDLRTRRDRLDDMAFAQKEFSAANAASPAWMESLLTAAEVLPDQAYRQEAVLALSRVAYRAASGVVQVPTLLPKAAAMAELSARRRHGPSAVLMAVLTEAGAGPGAKASAARWYAVAGVGFDMDASAQAEALRILAEFTAAERAEAARLMGGKGSSSPRALLELAKK